MMELNDNEFDAAFRKKVFDADLQFEEGAWDKMEQKLQRRARVVFFRKAAVLCLLLSIGFGGYFMLNQEPVRNDKSKMVKKVPVISSPVVEPGTKAKVEGGDLVYPSGLTYTGDKAGNTGQRQKTQLGMKPGINPVLSKTVQQKSSSAGEDSISQPAVPQALAQVLTTDKASNKADSGIVASTGTDVLPASVASVVKKAKPARNKARPMSLSLSIGPEFNSVSALVGGKKGFSAGLGFSLGIAKRVTLQTGLKYSMKDYSAENYAYQFRNPKVKDLIAGVDASCAVLEIPLQASYTFWDDARKSIDVNVGVSSYFMLKEDYTYRYTTASGIADRYQEYRNKNQHYFGVADISATYYIKLKKENLRLGLEPYVKIPLTGVGEGKVNLKSSGLSLKLRYDLGKKNN